MAVSVRLLGPAKWRLHDEWVEVPPLKTTAVPLYLAFRDAWVDREELIYLLWPDAEEDRARRNLRQLLTKVRRLEHAEGLEVERSRLRWRADTDVRAFRQALNEGRHARAAELYAGPLMQDFRLSKAPEFEAWLEFERHELHAAWRDAVLEAAHELEGADRAEPAAALLERLVKSDPMDEEAARRLLASLYRAGRRGDARTAYRALQRTLRDELEVEPEPATNELADRIERNEPLGSPTALPARSAPAALPTPPTAFVGREAELAQVLERIDDPACRLLSLVGPGGSGKTRLAIEAARRRADAFAGGARFVPLAPLRSAQWLVPAIADALGFAFVGAEAPERQLLQHLRGEELLLVLDNLEHVVDGLELLGEMLDVAPRVKLLTTSRQRLELQAEWVVDVAGLEVGGADLTADAERVGMVAGAGGDALRLFEQAARRSRADVDFGPDAQARAVRICRALGGMPLALELAADWVRVLSLEQIEAEVAGGLDFLTSPARDAPERHRSLRAVFDHSWRLLSEPERAVMRKLAAFRGGFTRDAAAAVADASLPMLLALSNKSLLRTVRAGRFERHPLVWQFADEQARAHPDERAAARERHATYFARQLQPVAGTLRDERALDAYRWIEADIDNVRAAWQWAGEHGREDLLDMMVLSLGTYYLRRTRSEEGRAMMRLARRHLPAHGLVQARLAQKEAQLSLSQQDLESAEELTRAAVEAFRPHGASPDLAFGLRMLGLAITARRDETSEEAKSAFQESLALYRRLDDDEGVAMMLNVLSFHCPAVEESERLLHEAAEIARRHGDRRTLAMVLESLAQQLSHRAGRHDDAARVAEEGLTAMRGVGDLLFLAPTLRCAGDAALAAGQLELAEQRYRDLFAMSDSLQGGLRAETRAFACDRLGWLAYLDGELPGALEASEQARTYLHDLEAALCRAEVLAHSARIALSCGRPEAERHVDELLTWAAEVRGEGELPGKVVRVVGHALSGDLSLAAGDAGRAAESFTEALTLAGVHGLLPEALRTLVGVARWAARAGEREQAWGLLTLALREPSAAHDARVEARRAAAELELEVTGDGGSAGTAAEVGAVCRAGLRVLHESVGA